MLLCSLKSSKKRLITSDTIGRLTLFTRAIAWLIATISSREKCRNTPAEVESPMLSIRIAACSTELSERGSSERFLMSFLADLACSSDGVKVSFISSNPLFDDFRDALRIVLSQHLQMLHL